MEVIELAGYTEEEKLEIAKRYLIPRQIERNGLTKSKIEITDAAHPVIADYTREAGLNLEREIATLCRKVAVLWAEGKVSARSRCPRSERASCWASEGSFTEARSRTDQPGVATGLAWTPVGGDVLFVEASAMPGSGQLTLTGQLGEVMKESAQAAVVCPVTRPRARLPATRWFAEHDIHLHVPAGAIPKDGPSARASRWPRRRVAAGGGCATTSR